MAINTNILKTYAPEARRAFIAAVKARAARFGITEQGSSAIREEGNVAIINEQPYPRSFAQQRRDLDQKIAVRGYASVMEEVAYTWFNRFAAIRYMELHDYLEHGVRVLSHPNGGSTPEIIEKAAQIEIPGLKRDQVIALKLDGTKDDELYRMLIVAQCNALHAVMPFLFEKIEDETELLLPDNLLHSESLVRQLVERIPDADWQHIEIIGWLYQFYISEKKDQVIGTVVKSEDIPAATQLFTPNWIVKYMVQNSLGAKWLATYPGSTLRAKMEYYVPPGVQAPEVQTKIDAETPRTLDPEALTFLDPASGSGHILVEAYDLFKEIYLERGYRLREIPRLVLEKNVYGLDIDDRAAQLSGFALMMRARADDRGILSSVDPVELNVLSLQDSKGVITEHLLDALGPTSEQRTSLRAAVEDLVALFVDAKTLGSLISIPNALVDVLPMLRGRMRSTQSGDLLDRASLQQAKSIVSRLVRQAQLLGRQYDVVSANPPYMGSKGMNGSLKPLVQARFPDSKSDVFACFIERSLSLTKSEGWVAMVTMESWMFLSSFERLRKKLLDGATIQSMVHMPYLGKGGTSMGINFGTAVFSLKHTARPQYEGKYYCLRYFETDQRGIPLAFPPDNERSSTTSSDKLRKIPGGPIAYWATDRILKIFSESASLGALGSPTHGVVTGDNDRFLRQWHEVSQSNSKFGSRDRSEAQASGVKWFPATKGGPFRRWYGNLEHVIDWHKDGATLQTTKHVTGRIRATNFNLERIFQPGITWSTITSGQLSMRYLEPGLIFESKGSVCFSDDEDNRLYLLALTNTKVTSALLLIISPTLDFHEGPMSRIPVVDMDKSRPIEIATRLRTLSKTDWDSFETSWNFCVPPLLTQKQSGSLAKSYETCRTDWRASTLEMHRLEEENNRIFIEAYGLQDELVPDVELESVSLTRNPAYRYGKGKSEANLETLMLADSMREFLSYAVGCMFGRYALDEPGLILATQGDTIQDYLRRVPASSFQPDQDNVIPVMEEAWLEEDVVDRFQDFLRVTFGEELFRENLAFIEAALGKEVRKFFKRDFYADHLRRYKKRPIYWLFSSGKERTFEALVYMHRYNEGTLARMRLEYVAPLQTQMAGRVQRLTDELRAGNLSSFEIKKREVQLEKLQKQYDELRRFEEELHHFADQRIKLDLDDGVKVNYGKFGNLLADVKAITGGKDDE